MKSIMVAVLLCAACNYGPPAVAEQAKPNTAVFTGLGDHGDVYVFRVHDTEAHVTCWAMTGYNGRSGLACKADKEIQ